MKILEHLEYKLEEDSVLEKMRIPAGSEEETEVRELVRQAIEVANPKAVYKESFIKRRGNDEVLIDGVSFRSHVLHTNLAEVERVFAYIVTCGHELDLIPIPESDFVKVFWLDALKEQVFIGARNSFVNKLKHQFQLKKIASMNPGSGDADTWPLEQQKPFFSLFGNPEELIGVKLNDVFLMHPNKTVSGILYQTEKDFATCRICHRENCRNRRAKYDEHFASQYAKQILDGTCGVQNNSAGIA